MIAGRCRPFPLRAVRGSPGFVYLDDIKAATHVWTSASDNGGGETITADPTGASFVSSLLGEPVATALSK